MNFKKNILILIRFYLTKINKFLSILNLNLSSLNNKIRLQSTKSLILNSSTTQNNSIHMENSYSFIHKLSIFFLKILIFFITLYLFVIYPLFGLINHGVESFNKNKYVSIIILDFIDNPLTHLRLAELYLKSGNINKAKLFIEYAIVSNAKYGNNELIKLKILELQNLINKI